jgi:hypothetical protein
MSEENSPSDIVGRKIFFLYPTASVQNQIISELVQQEYEVYIAKDHNRLSRSLKKYTDAIIFVNIDEHISEAEWEKWISGVLTALPTIEIGVFSSSADEELKNKYIDKLKVRGGFLVSKTDMSKNAEKVFEILKIMNAKGRRKYLRATVEPDANASMNIPFEGDFINGSIKDISVVGIACAFEHDPSLTKNSLLKDIQIRLQSILIKAEAIVFGTREDAGEKNYVMLFTQRTDPEVRVKIRKYIQNNFQHKMDQEIN